MEFQFCQTDIYFYDMNSLLSIILIKIIKSLTFKAPIMSMSPNTPFKQSASRQGRNYDEVNNGIGGASLPKLAHSLDSSLASQVANSLQQKQF
jgi:hypothetical protein